MIVQDLSEAELLRRLSGDGVALRTGPFGVRVRSPFEAVARSMAKLYSAHPVLEDGEFCDFTLQLFPSRGLRRWIRPQVQAWMEGHPLFEPLPQDQAFALMEWTMNWWVSGNAHQYLLLHAAVVERDGRAAILPAPPGSGKSTLCAALVQRGWRLLSDELGMVDLQQGLLWPLARPVSLKNASLDVIQRFESAVVLGEAVRDTAKGTVAHMKPKQSDVALMSVPAQPRWVVFPRYVAGAELQLAPRPKADAMMELGRNAFNYALLGLAGFEILVDLVSRSDCLDFSYSRLEDAIATFDKLSSSATP